MSYFDSEMNSRASNNYNLSNFNTNETKTERNSPYYIDKFFPHEYTEKTPKRNLTISPIKLPMESQTEKPRKYSPSHSSNRSPNRRSFNKYNNSEYPKEDEKLLKKSTQVLAKIARHTSPNSRITSPSSSRSNYSPSRYNSISPPNRSSSPSNRSFSPSNRSFSPSNRLYSPPNKSFSPDKGDIQISDLENSAHRFSPSYSRRQYSPSNLSNKSPSKNSSYSLSRSRSRSPSNFYSPSNRLSTPTRHSPNFILSDGSNDSPTQQLHQSQTSPPNSYRVWPNIHSKNISRQSQSPRSTSPSRISYTPTQVIPTDILDDSSSISESTTDLVKRGIRLMSTQLDYPPNDDSESTDTSHLIKITHKNISLSRPSLYTNDVNDDFEVPKAKTNLTKQFSREISHLFSPKGGAYIPPDSDSSSSTSNFYPRKPIETGPYRGRYPTSPMSKNHLSSSDSSDDTEAILKKASMVQTAITQAVNRKSYLNTSSSSDEKNTNLDEVSESDSIVNGGYNQSPILNNSFDKQAVSSLKISQADNGLFEMKSTPKIPANKNRSGTFSSSSDSFKETPKFSISPPKSNYSNEKLRVVDDDQSESEILAKYEFKNSSNTYTSPKYSVKSDDDDSSEEDELISSIHATIKANDQLLRSVRK